MAVKTWGMLNGELINICDVDKEKYQDIRCVSCSQPLVPNQGSKYEWHFKHKTDTNCTGGSAETILHKIAKTIFKKDEEFCIPPVMLQFKQPEVIREKETSFINTVEVEECVRVEVLKKKGDVTITQTIEVKPDITLTLTNGMTVYVELYVSHKVTEEKRKKYSCLRNRFTVVEIDLRKYAKLYDTPEFDIEAFKRDILGDSDCKYVITTSNLREYEQLLEQATYTFSNKSNVLCPADGFKSVMSSKDCASTCPFYVGKTGKIHKCYGRLCFSSAEQVTKHANSVSKNNSTDNTGKYTAEERYDLDSMNMPKPVGEVLYKDKVNPIGICPKCGGDYIFALGNGAVPFTDEYLRIKGDTEPNRVIIGIEEIKDENGYIKGKRYNYQPEIHGVEAHYRYCPSCGHAEVIECPKCKEQGITAYMQLKAQKLETGKKVFLGCQRYHKRNKDKNCDETITVYTEQPATKSRFADEILAVGSLDFYLNNYKKAVKLIRECKNNAKGDK